MGGYLNDVEESSLKLKSGWYDTGDLGYMDADGYLYHKGRLKRFVKIGGEMVSLVAVEECLNNVTDMDCECCVVELPDAKRGSKIVAVTSKAVDSSKTNKRLSEDLPNIALPRKYVTVSSFLAWVAARPISVDLPNTCGSWSRKRTSLDAGFYVASRIDDTRLLDPNP